MLWDVTAAIGLCGDAKGCPVKNVGACEGSPEKTGTAWTGPGFENMGAPLPAGEPERVGSCSYEDLGKCRGT
jgi:hypothetical protein